MKILEEDNSHYFPHDAEQWRYVGYLLRLQTICRYERTGMPCDPEDVLDSSGLEPASAACFLHENCPHFVHDDAIDNFLAALDYFSDAGEECLSMAGFLHFLTMVHSLIWCA